MFPKTKHWNKILTCKLGNIDFVETEWFERFYNLLYRSAVFIFLYNLQKLLTHKISIIF